VVAVPERIKNAANALAGREIILTRHSDRYIPPARHCDAAKSAEMDMDDSPSRRFPGSAFEMMLKDVLAVRRAMDLETIG
jgi:hypothetical protein